MVHSALGVKAHPLCLPGPAIEFEIGWVMYPGFLSPFVGYHKIGLCPVSASYGVTCV